MFRSLIACAVSSSVIPGDSGISRSTSNSNCRRSAAPGDSCAKSKMLRASFQSWITLLRMIASAIGRNRFEEIARDEFDAIADADLPKMVACGLGAPRKVENSSAQFPVLLRDGAEQFAGSAADVHQVGYPAEIVEAKDIRR